MTAYRFPKGFMWGTATSAYQVEGAAQEDGRGPSIWDEFCATPGKSHEGQSGATACDHYHRWAEDLDLVRAIGFGSYRFSVAWPRVFPDGVGAPNQKGLDFYHRIVDGCLERGIEPFVCLYHWDLPLALEKKGGWRERRTSAEFADYAAFMAGALGDRVKWWITFNEIPCIIHAGYENGDHAPGWRAPRKVVRQVAHHVLLAHGLAVQAVRANARRTSVGIVHNFHPPVPFSERAEDVAEARHHFETLNGWLLDPMLRGAYPKTELRGLGKDAPRILRGDMGTIAQPLDWFGVNFYTSWDVVTADGRRRDVERHYPRTDMDWPVTEDGVYWLLRWMHELYGCASLFVSENGCGYPDKIDADGCVEDFARIQYLRSHLRMVHRAVTEGLPVRGYHLWSLLDNFEWAYGYSKRFGMVHVNYETFQRTPKLSARWMRQVIEDNGL
jgi:beta-glucosidase